MLPDHESKTEQEDSFSRMGFKEGFHALNIQFHLFIQGITALTAEHGET